MTRVESAVPPAGQGVGASPTLRMTAERLRASLQPAAAPALPSIPGYELIELLGRGGMGVVYKARQKSLNRIVALKLLSDREAAEEGIARFFQEAEAIGALQHPNVVQVHEVGEFEGRPFLSLEYVDGGTLHTRIQGRPQSPAFAAEMCETLARAVHAVHSIQIIHRDLKPANILLQAAGSRPTAIPVPKITDFGLAKRMDTPRHLTETGITTGTPAYMSPEQVRGERSNIGPATDIWALGVILYEMLTGRPPFEANCPIQTMSDVLSVTPESPSRIVRGTPRDLETICAKCLEKSPGRRYRSALELAEDLRRYQEGRPIVARRVGAIEQSWRWCARNPAVAGLLAGLLVVFATGAGVASAYAFEADRSARLAGAERTKAESSAIEARAKADEANAARQDEAKAKARAEKLAQTVIEREQRGLRERYALDANLALVAWNEGDVQGLQRFLERYSPKPGEPDLRAFEWHYLDRLSRSESSAIRLGGAGRVNRMTLLRKGEGIVYGQEEKVCIYDPAHGPNPRVLAGHASGVQAVTTNPVTGELASVSWDGTVRIWDPESGKCLHVLRGNGNQLFDVKFTPDGQSLVACGGAQYGAHRPGELVIWDLKTRRPRHTLREHDSTVHAIAISADGKWLVSCGWNGQVLIHDVATGERLRSWRHPRAQTALILDPKKKWFATGTPNGTIAVCDAETGALLRELHGHTDQISALACSRFGTWVASGSHDGSLRIWNPATGEMYRHFRGHVGIINGIAFRPGTETILSVGNEGILRSRELHVRQDVTILSDDMWDAMSIGLAKEPNELLSFGVNGHIRRWNISEGRGIPRENPRGTDSMSTAAILLPDGDTVAYVQANLVIAYTSLTGKPVAPVFRRATRGIALAASANGQTLAVLRDWRWVDLFGLKANSAPITLEVVAPAHTLAVGPGDDPILAIPHEGGRMELYRMDKSLVRSIPTGQDCKIESLVFSPDGAWLAGGDKEGRVRLWDVRTGEERWQLKAHRGGISSIAFSPSVDRLLSTGGDNSIRIIDVITGRETLTLRGHSRMVKQAMFSADGKSILSVGYDSKLIRW